MHSRDPVLAVDRGVLRVLVLRHSTVAPPLKKRKIFFDQVELAVRGGLASPINAFSLLSQYLYPPVDRPIDSTVRT
jgi:hypothetical protein